MEQSTLFTGEPHMKLVPQGIILVSGWERRELKHLSNARNINHRDSVSSGERKRNSLNPNLFGCCRADDIRSNFCSRKIRNDFPKRVKDSYAKQKFAIVCT